jgi:hypothetical protein
MTNQENGQVQEAEVSETNGYGMVEQSNIDNMFTRLKDSWEPGSKKRVMIVDDDQDMRAIVRTHLTMNGIEVCEAINRDFPDDHSLAMPRSLCVNKYPYFTTDSGSHCRTICLIEGLGPTYSRNPLKTQLYRHTQGSSAQTDPPSPPRH